jgi:hypothetical protein
VSFREARKHPAVASTMPALPSMPILIAATAKSANTASICAATISGGGQWIALTPRVFWTVSAVIALAA